MNRKKECQYEVRLAKNTAELKLAQTLRYTVFYTELGATPSFEMVQHGRDFDIFDDVCDHLLVIDRMRSNGAICIVGTYRLLRKTVALKHFGFYSQQEYDISSILTYAGEAVELGRSCIAPGNRTGTVMQLLWGGIAEYIARHNIELLFGCASFPGTEVTALKSALSYLYYNHLAPEQLRPCALKSRYVDMRQRTLSGTSSREIINQLPPLIKGYLRAGSFVGDGAVIDRQFNTTDVCLIVETEKLTQRYRRHYQESLSIA